MGAKTTFGFLGTFGPWHGVDVLQELIPIVVKQEHGAHFLLMGEGAGRAPLEERLRREGMLSHVTFTGKIVPSIVPSYLVRCDAFLCPTQPNSDGSRFFGSPTKLFEYLSMARPIIASDLEQVAQVVSPALYVSDIYSRKKIVTDEVGILVNYNNISGFVDACLYVASLPESERIKMGRNARKKALNQYTWLSHVKKMVEYCRL